MVVRPALGATASDVLAADGYLLGTPANLGYMSGALKHFFDQIYYPCLDATVGRPYGLSSTATTTPPARCRAVEMVTTGLRWRLAQPVLLGDGRAGTGRARRRPGSSGAALAAGLAEG